jgi:hypothetical protein
MATLLSEQFLRVHPATQAWWQRRERCESCKHSRLKRGEGNEGVLRCNRAQHPNPLVRQMLSARVGADLRPYCIDASDEGGQCGPDGKLYEGK